MEKVFEDPFFQDLEYLFFKEDIVFNKLLNEDKTIAEVINALVKLTKSAKDTKALLADISR